MFSNETIAHSMGNRALITVLSDIAKQSIDNISIKQVILAAPDINSKEFCEILVPKIKHSAYRISLYASSRDRALKISDSFHDSARAGESGDKLVVLNGIDTIDASKVDTGLLGHGYFADSKQVIDDIFQLVRHGSPPDERNLRECLKGDLKYWEFP